MLLKTTSLIDPLRKNVEVHPTSKFQSSKFKVVVNKIYFNHWVNLESITFFGGIENNEFDNQ